MSWGPAVDPTYLPDHLVAKLRAANRQIVDWLARDSEHRKLFLERPVAALVQAGVDLTPNEMRTLVRAHQARRGASPARPAQAGA